MERRATLGAVIDRLAADFPGLPRREVVVAAVEAWALFEAERDEPVIRAVVTEWYVRTNLQQPAA